MKLKFYFDKCVWADRIDVFLIGEDASGKRFIAKPMNLEFEPIEPSAALRKPSLSIDGFTSREFLPALANGLAEAGYQHESTDAGELKATKYHLEDMRRISMSK